MTLRRIMRKAKKQKLIPDNPAEDIVLPSVTQGSRRPITDGERAIYLKQLKHIMQAQWCLPCYTVDSDLLKSDE